MSIQADFVTYLKTKSTITAITSKIAVGFISDLKSAPFIGIFKDDETKEDDLKSNGLKTCLFAVECVGTTNLNSIALGDTIETAIHGDSGTFGATTAKGIFVESVTDDYVFRNVEAAQGDLVYGLSVEVIY